MFNSLQTVISGAEVLDLFAGSGALGFEALSRGASRVAFVENAHPVVRLLHENARALKVEDRVSIREASVGDLLGPGGGGLADKLGKFELILADPPYEAGWELKLLEQLPWDRLLVEGGHFALEWGPLKAKLEQLPEQVPWLVKVREKNYGDSVLTTYERTPT